MAILNYHEFGSQEVKVVKNITEANLMDSVSEAVGQLKFIKVWHDCGEGDKFYAVVHNWDNKAVGIVYLHGARNFRVGYPLEGVA